MSELPSNFIPKWHGTKAGWSYIDVRANQNGTFDILFQDRYMQRPYALAAVIGHGHQSSSIMPLLPREGICDHATALLYAKIYDTFFIADLAGLAPDYGVSAKLVEASWPADWRGMLEHRAKMAAAPKMAAPPVAEPPKLSVKATKQMAAAQDAPRKAAKAPVWEGELF